MRFSELSPAALLGRVRPPVALLILVVAWVAPAAAQSRGSGAGAPEGLVAGTVVREDGSPVPYATVGVSGAQRSVVSDASGAFALRGLAPGTHRLIASSQGYGVSELIVRVPAQERVTVVLRPDPVALEALTVTGTMQRSSVKESPVKVEVVPARVLQRTATNNLTEAIQYVNGLYNQVDCGVCYTNNIRINGMEGPYTAVLIDGMPLMSSLASVYGLNGINPALIEQIEIVKGPASTLYGSEAMAGVVNVITKDPRFAPRLSLDVHTTSEAEGNIDFAVAPEPGDVSGFVSGNVAYNQRFVDENGDGFTDFPLTRRAVLFAKADRATEGVRRGGLSAKYLYEDRFGGVRGWTTEDRGSDRVYGESVVTRRAELIGSWLPSWSDALRFEGSYTWHDQSSFYGDTEYDASQHVAFGNLLWSDRWGRHDLLVGASARYQRYDDNTPATSDPDARIVPGILLQDELRWENGSSALAGVRVDRYGTHGLVVSPRLALKWEPLHHTAFRLNAGTGFRAVNLFAEDHAALSGSREVVILSELRPERSRSVTLNVNQIIEIGPNPVMIDLDLFHTRFSNKIVADYDVDPRSIVYDNLAGHSLSRGIALSFNQNVDFDRFLYSAGVTLQDVHTVREGVREDEFFAPRVRVVGTATYNFRVLPLTLDYSGAITGPMRLPAYEEPFSRPERSPAYGVHNLQGTWRWGDGAALYLSVKNVLDYVQPSPLINPSDPFSDAFDTAYVYGPMRGRHLMLGFRYGVSR